jgi:hypothetical protein
VDKVSFVFWGGVWYIMTKVGIDNTFDLTPPGPLSGLTADSYYASIDLSWDIATDPLHAYTEIYRSTVDTVEARNAAEMIGGTTAFRFMDTPPNKSTSVTYYYWIRSVSTSFIQGPWNASEGVAGSTADDPSFLLEILAGQLGYGQFDVANGVFPIRTVTALPTLPDILHWPYGSRAYLTTTKEIYFCEGLTWTLEPDQAAIRAEFGVGVLTAGAVIAQSVGANEIIANTANIADSIITSAKIYNLVADKIAAGTIEVALVIQSPDEQIVLDTVNKSLTMTADSGNQAILTPGELNFYRGNTLYKSVKRIEVGLCYHNIPYTYPIPFVSQPSLFMVLQSATTFDLSLHTDAPYNAYDQILKVYAVDESRFGFTQKAETFTLGSNWQTASPAGHCHSANVTNNGGTVTLNSISATVNNLPKNMQDSTFDILDSNDWGTAMLGFRFKITCQGRVIVHVYREQTYGSGTFTHIAELRAAGVYEYEFPDAWFTANGKKCRYIVGLFSDDNACTIVTPSVLTTVYPESQGGVIRFLAIEEGIEAV